jgi:hypothetical protein
MTREPYDIQCRRCQRSFPSQYYFSSPGLCSECFLALPPGEQATLQTAPQSVQSDPTLTEAEAHQLERTGRLITVTSLAFMVGFAVIRAATSNYTAGSARTVGQVANFLQYLTFFFITLTGITKWIVGERRLRSLQAQSTPQGMTFSQLICLWLAIALSLMIIAIPFIRY